VGTAYLWPRLDEGEVRVRIPSGSLIVLAISGAIVRTFVDPKSWCGPRTLEIFGLTLKAFFDETGTHRGSPVTCMGGYVFDEHGEDQFSAEWHEVLQPFTQCGIEFFHANKCYGLKGEFRNLNDEQRSALFTKLIILIRRTAKFGIISAIRDEIFASVMQRNKFQTFTGSKYTVCALRSLTLLEQWADEHRFDGRIVYLFESGNEHQGEADAMMQAIRKTPKMREAFRYQRHDFVGKAAFPPLQAADMFVWLFQRWFCQKKQDRFLKELLRDGGISHLYQEVTDLSLNMLALVNMHYGVKSDRKYQTQRGRIKKYQV
jgi:hypothetical protein